MKLPSKTIFWFLIFLLLGFSLALFDQLGWLNWFYRLTQPTLTSLHLSSGKLRQRLDFSDWGQRFCPDQSDRLRELEKEVARLGGLEAQLSSCQDEVRSSRRLLGAPLPADWQFLPLKLFKINEGFFVNQGRRGGVKEGLPLIWENVYLGKIVEVQEEVAKAELVKEMESKTPVKIRAAGGFQAKGILYGQGGLEAEMGRILAQEAVGQGNLVVTTGDLHLPPDLAVGQVKEVTKEEGQVYQEAEVQLLLDPEKLEVVFLLTKR